MPRTVALLRILWLVLMAGLAVLLLTNLIGGYWAALYGAVVLTVMLAEARARQKAAPRS